MSSVKPSTVTTLRTGPRSSSAVAADASSPAPGITRRRSASGAGSRLPVTSPSGTVHAVGTTGTSTVVVAFAAVAATCAAVTAAQGYVMAVVLGSGSLPATCRKGVDAAPYASTSTASSSKTTGSVASQDVVGTTVATAFSSLAPGTPVATCSSSLGPTAAIVAPNPCSTAPLGNVSRSAASPNAVAPVGTLVSLGCSPGRVEA